MDRVIIVSKMLPSDGPVRSVYFFHDRHEVPDELCLYPGGHYSHEDQTCPCTKWVPGTFELPMRVVPRPGLESGLIETVDQLIFVFHKDDIKIERAEAKNW